MPRQDTKLEAEGAEFLVLGSLLIEGINCFKAYTNFAGYDIVAVNPESNKTARIQVKSRWASDAPWAFLIKNFDCDYVVYVRLNRGNRNNGGNRRDPEFYCFPVEVVKAAHSNNDWGKVSVRNIADYDTYKTAWGLIAEFVAPQA
jgi:hypothetical protein